MRPRAPVRRREPELGDRRLVLACTSEGYAAFDDHCTHRGGSLADGIYVSGSSNVTISGNTVTGSGKPVSGGTAPGISLRGTNSSTVSGNTADQNNGHGILLTSSSTGHTVSGNEVEEIHDTAAASVVAGARSA